LAIYVFAVENPVIGVKADHEDVRRFAVGAAAPFGHAKIERRRESDLGRTPRLIQPA